MAARTVKAWGMALVLVIAPGAIPVAQAQVEALSQIPNGLRAATRAQLSETRNKLRLSLAQMSEDGKLFNRQCASVRKNSPEAANCRRRFSVLDGKRLAYNKQVEAFNARVSSAIASDRLTLEAELVKLRGRIARHQQALRNLGFETTARQFEDYAEMSETGRAQATGVLASAVLTITLTRAEKYILKHRPTNERAAVKIGDKLYRAGVRDPFVLDAADKLHTLKPAAIKKFFKLLKASGKTAIAGATSGDAKKAAATLIIEAATAKIKDQGIAKALGVGKLLLNSVIYAETYDRARQGTERLMEVSEQQAAGLRRIDAMLRTDVAGLARTKRDLRNLGAKP